MPVLFDHRPDHTSVPAPVCLLSPAANIGANGIQMPDTQPNEKGSDRPGPDSGGTIACHAWAFPGEAPGASGVDDPGAVTCDTAGTFPTRLSANADSGASCVAVMLVVTVAPSGGANAVGVDQLKTGVIGVKGRNQAFRPATVFSPRDALTFRATVLDGCGSPRDGATVGIENGGPVTASVTREPSDATGVAEASWNTSSKGKNPTPNGSYTATSGVSASGYSWDGVGASAGFTIQ